MFIIFLAIFVGNDITLESDIFFAKPGDQGFITTPKDMTADQDGNVYLLDVGLKTIHCWNNLGHYLGRFGSEGEGPGEFSFHNGVGSMTCFENRIIIFDEGLGKLHIWDRKSRQFSESLIMPDGLRRLPAFGTVDGRLVVINASASQRDLVVMNGDFKQYKTLASTDSPVYVRSKNGWDFYPFANIPLVGFGRKYIFLAETNHNWIKKMDPSGKIVDQFQAPILPEDLSTEEREDTRNRATWLGANDRIHFPEKRHVFLQIAALGDEQLLLLTDYQETEGVVKGFLMDGSGVINGKFHLNLENEIGFFGVAGTHAFLVDSDKNQDYRLRRYVLKPTDE